MSEQLYPPTDHYSQTYENSYSSPQALTSGYQDPYALQNSSSSTVQALGGYYAQEQSQTPQAPTSYNTQEQKQDEQSGSENGGAQTMPGAMPLYAYDVRVAEVETDRDRSMRAELSTSQPLKASQPSPNYWGFVKNEGGSKAIGIAGGGIGMSLTLAGNIVKDPYSVGGALSTAGSTVSLGSAVMVGVPNVRQEWQKYKAVQNPSLPTADVNQTELRSYRGDAAQVGQARDGRKKMRR